jgi:hypothetical protein
MTSQLMTAPAAADAPPAWATKRRHHRVAIFFAGVTGTLPARVVAQPRSNSGRSHGGHENQEVETCRR